MSNQNTIKSVRDALDAADWQMLRDAVGEILTMTPDRNLVHDLNYADGWNDCHMAAVVTFAEYFGIEGESSDE